MTTEQTVCPYCQGVGLRVADGDNVCAHCGGTGTVEA